MSARLARSWVPMLTSKGIVRSSPTNRGSRCSSPALLSNAVSVHVSGDGAMVRGSTNKLRGALLAKQTARSTAGMGATGCGAVRRLSCFLLFVVTSADTSLATRQAFALRAASCPRVGGKATPPSLDSHASCSHVSQLAAVRCCRRPGDAGAACVSICAESQAACARGFAVARSRMQFEPYQHKSTVYWR